MTFCTSKRVRFVVVLVALVLSASPAGLLFAQVTGATLAGTVTDSSGAILAGAQVEIENLNTAVTRNTVSDKDGLYSAPNLLPGSYQLTISAPGFKTEVRRGLTLNVGGTEIIDVKMTVVRCDQARLRWSAQNLLVNFWKTLVAIPRSDCNT